MTIRTAAALAVLITIATVTETQARPEPVCNNDGKCILIGASQSPAGALKRKGRYHAAHKARPRNAAPVRRSISKVQTASKPSRNGLAAVTSASGKVAWVAPSAAGQFQGFVRDLEASGYRIDFMGGWRRHGSCRGCNMHPAGLAIDIDQIARNRLWRGKRLPEAATAIASRWGLLHGAVWRNADAGHFEVARRGAGGWPQRFADQKAMAIAGRKPEIVKEAEAR